MGPVLVELAQLDQTLRARPPHKWLNTGSVHASLIQGGQELSSYPERCVLSIERRTLPGETAELVEGELQEIVRKIGRFDPTFKAAVRRGIARMPLETPEDGAVVQTVQQAARTVLNQTPQMAGVAYWTDAATLWAAGIPTVLFGPTGAGAHAAQEWVDMDSVQTCAEIYLAAAQAFCQ